MSNLWLSSGRLFVRILSNPFLKVQKEILWWKLKAVSLKGQTEIGWCPVRNAIIIQREALQWHEGWEFQSGTVLEWKVTVYLARVIYPLCKLAWVTLNIQALPPSGLEALLKLGSLELDLKSSFHSPLACVWNNPTKYIRKYSVWRSAWLAGHSGQESDVSQPPIRNKALFLKGVVVGGRAKIGLK